jgi:hypothetical protein
MCRTISVKLREAIQRGVDVLAPAIQFENWLIECGRQGNRVLREVRAGKAM